MSKTTRRKAILAAAASSSMLLSTGNKNAEATTPKKWAYPDFLMPWSPPPDLRKNLTTGTTPIRLACGAHTLGVPKDGNIDKVVKNVHDNGYTAAIVGGGYGRRNLWTEASDTLVADLKTALKKYDVRFADMHSIYNMIHPDLAERKRLHAWFIEQMETAERVGCPIVTGHVGSRAPGAVHPHPENWTKETWDMSVREVKKVIKDSAGIKTVIAFEPNDMVQLNNPWACRRFIDDVGSDRVKICLDPANMTNQAFHFRMAEYIPICYDLIGEDAAICHAKDIMLENKLHPSFVEVPVGQGAMDYETHLAGMSRLNHTRVLFVEHMKAEEYPVARRYLEGVAENLGIEFI
ncbi:sugar phosphate isomerase/epimerase family protein [Candidatus Omnitrophota bacterium]